MAVNKFMGTPSNREFNGLLLWCHPGRNAKTPLSHSTTSSAWNWRCRPPQTSAILDWLIGQWVIQLCYCNFSLLNQKEDGLKEDSALSGTSVQPLSNSNDGFINVLHPSFQIVQRCPVSSFFIKTLKNMLTVIKSTCTLYTPVVCKRTPSLCYLD